MYDKLSNMMAATNWAGTAYVSGAPEFQWGYDVAQSFSV